MVCDGCGNQYARRLRVTKDGQTCDNCGRLGLLTCPDIYFRGAYLDPHLIDPARPEQKNGVWIESRNQKAEIMKNLGVQEVGDRVRGYRPYDASAIRREGEKRHAV